MRRFESHYRLRDDDNLEARVLNAILADVDARIAAGEDVRDAVENAISELNKVGLERINSVLTPQIERIQLAGELGFLKIRSATPHSLVLGNIVTFVVEDTARRALFHPTTFLDVLRTSTIDDRAIGLVHDYDPDNGELLVEFVAVFGAAGPHSDWEICASGGAAAAQLQMLAEARAARNEAIAARGAAETAAGTATTKAGEAATARDTAVGAAGTATAKAGEAEASAIAAALSAASVDTAAINAHARRQAIRFSVAL